MTASLYGGLPAPPALLPLRAGPLTLFYEEGALRYVRCGDREVIRRVYAAVRDHNWGTPPARITAERIDVRPTSFAIAFTAHHRAGDLHFVWQGRIAGGADGTIDFHFDGVAQSTFWRNRIGFCVLHPARECPGAALVVEHGDGSVVRTRFPLGLAPDNPHTDIRALTHEIAPGRWCRVSFTGELFEMEDQRNWLDASFKTFGTPLRRPFPVEIPAGTRVIQSVRIALEGNLPDAPAVAAAPGGAAAHVAIELELAPEAGPPLPALGLALPREEAPWSAREVTRLRALNLAHLRTEVTLGDPRWPQALGYAADRARALNRPLEVALFLQRESGRDLAALASCLARDPVPVARWLVFAAGQPCPVDSDTMSQVRQALADRCPGARFGTGTDTFFVFLNRSRPPVAAVEFVCYTINPQVHASDHRSLVETLEVHAATVDTARTFAGGRPVVVSPITLRMRYNPAATAPEPPPGPHELPTHVDPRQRSLFGAAWTLGSLKHLAEAGVAAATYFETTGWLGVLETAAGPPRPDLFPSTPGMVFPLYHVFADVGDFAGGRVLPLRSGDTLRVEGLSLAHGRRRRVLLANLTGEPQSIRLRLPVAPAGPIGLRRLTDAHYTAATQTPEAYRSAADETVAAPGRELRLDLSPGELARLDFAIDSRVS